MRTRRVRVSKREIRPVSAVWRCVCVCLPDGHDVLRVTHTRRAMTRLVRFHASKCVRRSGYINIPNVSQLRVRKARIFCFFVFLWYVSRAIFQRAFKSTSAAAAAAALNTPARTEPHEYQSRYAFNNAKPLRFVSPPRVYYITECSTYTYAYIVMYAGRVALADT